MSTPTLATAAQALEERLRARAAQDRPTLTVHELIERRMAVYAGRDESVVYRLKAWQHLIGRFTLAEIDADFMRDAREALKALPALAYKGVDHEGRPIYRAKTRHGTKHTATLNRYQAAISGVFTWAIEEGLAPKKWGGMNPCRGVRRLADSEARVRFLDRDELARLLAACRVQSAPDGKTRAYRGARYPRLYALVLMAVTTGARKGELLGLTWRDVDLERGRALLGRTKNGDRRALVLTPPVVEALRPFAGEAARFVFGSARSRCREPASIDTAWRAAMARAGLEDFRFHDLRHCCASYLAQAGKPLNVIAEVLGHRKLDMTRRYAHLTVQTKAQAIEDVFGTMGL